MGYEERRRLGDVSIRKRVNIDYWPSSYGYIGQ